MVYGPIQVPFLCYDLSMPIKKILIFTFFLFFALSAQADQEFLRKQASSTISKIDLYLKMKKNYPKQDHSLSLRRTQRDILMFNNILIEGKGTATDATIRLNAEATIDYYTAECEHQKTNKMICKAATETLADYKKKYNADYKPKKPNYPEIDFEKYSYTLNGKTYDLKNLKYVSALPQAPVISVVSATTTVSSAAVVSGYKCEWDTALPPRKLLFAPGCSGSGKVCSGFVKCIKNGYKINRLATCGSEFCTDATATECARQRGYGSKTPPAEQATAPKPTPDSKDVKGVN